MKDSIHIWTPDSPEGYGAFDIPVECDEDKSLCSHCETEKAMVQVRYERTYGIKKSFRIKLCMACYAHPDFQELKRNYQNVKVEMI